MKKFFCILLSSLFSVTCSAKYEDGLYAEIKTSHGIIVCKLFFEKVPMTVCNFVGLAEGTMKTDKRQDKPYYDGLVFHRVISNFMIQGGCPDGKGSGNPGYKFPDEFDSALRHDGPGVLSMANSGPATNGSQFFITHKATPWLNDKHSVFGKVIKGQDVVNKVQKDDVIESIKIVRSGKKAKAFKAGQEAFDEYSKDAFEKLRIEREKEEAAAKAAMAEQEAAVAKQLKERWPNATKTSSGLRYVVTKKGKGPKPQKGTKIKAHYNGKLLDGTKFDSSYDRGQPIEFPIGVGRVIPGWDEALLDMKKGEKRTLIIPPDLGYGSRGAGKIIPPNSYLVFDVELVDF